MSIRLITIDPSRASHYAFARKNRFWELVNRSNQLSPGDDVIFWVTGNPGEIVGRAVVASDVVAIDTRGQHRWIDDDPRRGLYSYRVALQDFQDIQPIKIRFAELQQNAGAPGRLNPVTAIPDSGQAWLEQRLSISLDPFNLPDRRSRMPRQSMTSLESGTRTVGSASRHLLFFAGVSVDSGRA